MNVVYGTHRKARLATHRCGFCRQLIDAGELYLDQRCADEGRMWTWRSHLRCNDFLNHVVEPFDDSGIDAQDFAELVAENPDLAAELGIAVRARQEAQT